MLPLTLAIITCNEEERISRAIASAGSVAEVLVVDSGSTDKTVAVAKGMGSRVIHAEWPGYGPQKNRALEEATENWVLSIDADEAITPELLDSIQELFRQGPKLKAYAFQRQNYWRGKRVRFGSYGPQWKTRLIQKGAGSWEGGILHETLETPETVGRLDGMLDHWPYRDEEDFRETSTAYAELFAQKALAEGRRARWWDTLFRPILHFVKSGLLKGGFLEGRRGLQLAFLGACEVAEKWSRLSTLQREAQMEERVS